MLSGKRRALAAFANLDFKGVAWLDRESGLNAITTVSAVPADGICPETTTSLATRSRRHADSIIYMPKRLLDNIQRHWLRTKVVEIAAIASAPGTSPRPDGATTATSCAGSCSAFASQIDRGWAFRLHI